MHTLLSKEMRRTSSEMKRKCGAAGRWRTGGGEVSLTKLQTVDALMEELFCDYYVT